MSTGTLRQRSWAHTVTSEQRMLCRTVRSRLPARAATREEKPVDMKHLTEQAKRAQRKQQRTYIRGSKLLAPLGRGQAVRIRHRGIWQQGTIERQDGAKGRLYIVKLMRGFYWRNCQDIRAARSGELASLSQQDDVQTEEGDASTQPLVGDSLTTARSGTPEPKKPSPSTHLDAVITT